MYDWDLGLADDQREIADGLLSRLVMRMRNRIGPEVLAELCYVVTSCTGHQSAKSNCVNLGIEKQPLRIAHDGEGVILAPILPWLSASRQRIEEAARVEMNQGELRLSHLAISLATLSPAQTFIWAYSLRWCWMTLMTRYACSYSRA